MKDTKPSLFFGRGTREINNSKFINKDNKDADDSLSLSRTCQTNDEVLIDGLVSILKNKMGKKKTVILIF